MHKFALPKHVVAAGDLRLRGRRRCQGAPRLVAAGDAAARRGVRSVGAAPSHQPAHGGTHRAGAVAHPTASSPSTGAPTTPRSGRFSTAPSIAAAPPKARAGARSTCRVPAKARTAPSATTTRASWSRTCARAAGSIALFDYTFDEPPADKLDEVRAAPRRAPRSRAERAAPGHPRARRQAARLRRHLVPDRQLHRRQSRATRKSPPRSRLRARERRLWWYQACMSHGCNIVGGSYFTGWPSYVVDAPAMSHRIFEWLTFRYRIGGELYYNTVEAYARGQRSVARSAAASAATATAPSSIPGAPRASAARRDIPVESVRLALIREGLEDYEYLQALRQGRRRKRGGGAGGDRSPARRTNGSTTPGACSPRATKWPKRSTRAVDSGGGIGVTAR